jgi:hypothetical protein
VGLLRSRWDKIGAWKGKMGDYEMADAELTSSHVVSRSAADVKAELDLVARLISGLPTNVEPGEYEAALATHLTSLFSALQLELEHIPEASGMRRRCAVVTLAVARTVHRTLGVAIMCSYVCACTATAESTLLKPEPSANAEPNSPHGNVSIVRTRSLPSLLYLWASLRAEPSYRSALRNLCRFRSHTSHSRRRAMTCRLPLQDSRRRGRSGWIRSFQGLLGRRKQQDASSVVSVVNATEPVGHSSARNARLGHRHPQAYVLEDAPVL